MTSPGDRAATVSSAAPDGARACPRCGARFQCGADTGRCWCASLPPLARLPSDLPPDCLCEACLRAELARDPRRC